MTLYKHYIPNTYYHIYTQGNQKQKIFFDDSDYTRFVQKMGQYATQYKALVLAYCLMTNHFHLLVKQETKIPLSKFIQALLVSHVRYFQKKHALVGHLFQGRFRAKIIDTGDDLLNLSRYIHQNPLMAVNNFSDAYLNSYQWSSYQEYTGKRRSFVDTSLILAHFSKKNPRLSYKEFIQTPLPAEEEKSLSFF